MLFADIQPVALANCELERFGEKNDGGYLLCRNLLGDVRAAYSYGISGYDQWGCDVSRRLGVRVHQYDCFNLTRPRCSPGKTVFHEECIAGSRRVEGGRPFDTLENQIQKNGDAGKQLVVKMDVEGAEWESFLGVSDDQLRRIDQLAVEFHGIDEARFIFVMSKLKEFFYIANLHWNNFGCDGASAPFPSWAYEIAARQQAARRARSCKAGGAQCARPAEQPGVARLPGRHVEVAPHGIRQAGAGSPIGAGMGRPRACIGRCWAAPLRVEVTHHGRRPNSSHEARRVL